MPSGSDDDGDSDSTEAETTVPGSTDPDDTDVSAPTSADTSDPARREWLEFADDADPDTFAGGAKLKELIDGTRVLMIGDSVMASTSSRYGGEMCDTLTTDGWQVEVDAETGRFIDFGDQVLDQRLDADFDVAVIMLGNNYGANPEVYEEYLHELVDRLEPRPTLLATVTVFQPNRAEVNDIIYDIAQDYDNVRVLDWAGATADDSQLTAGDGLHLSDLGRARFADMVAEELGDAPGRDDGDCLSSSFTDDSAGSTNTGPVEGQVTMPPSTWPTGNTTPSGGGGGDTLPVGTEPPPTAPATEPPPPVTEPPQPTSPPEPTTPPTPPPTPAPTNPPATVPPPPTAAPEAPPAPEG